MAKISPFKALRPAAEWAPKVASKPYDVLNSKEAKVEAEGNPYSFLHITKSEISLAENVDVHSNEVYEKAKQNLDAFIQRNVLFRESKSTSFPDLSLYKTFPETTALLGNNFNNEKQLTDFPLPDSPTMPRVSASPT